MNKPRTRARAFKGTLGAYFRMRVTIAGCLLGILITAGCGTDSSPASPDVEVPGESAVALADSARRMDLPENFPIKKILCFGDSVTFGVTQQYSGSGGIRPVLTTVEGYVPKLWRLLEERFGTGFELVNEGIGGENTREGLDRIDTMIRRHEPDLILILEGIVDVNNDVARFPVVRSNLAEMMRIGILRGKFVIIGTYLPVNPDGFRVFAVENITRLNDVIRQEGKRKNVPIADHEVAAPKRFRGVGSDGVHPNNLGYETMAQVWFESIVEKLEELGVS